MGPMAGDGGGKARVGNGRDVADELRGSAAQDDLVGLERRLGELDTERNLGGAIVDGHLRGDLELDVNLLWHRLFSPAGGEKEEGCKQPGQG